MVATVFPAQADRREHAQLATATRKTVVMKDNYFSPKTITIPKGTRIRWVNRGEVPHTTTSTRGLWDRTLAPGETYTRTFKRAGTFRYYCVFHSGMTGKIIVA